MKKYVVVDAAGEILEEHVGLKAPISSIGGAIVEVPFNFDSEAYWYADGEFVAKQPFPFAVSASQIVADGADTAAITGVPAGTSVRCPDGQTDEVTDGVVEFSVDLPGTYTLQFTAIPYLDAEVTIEAVPTT